MQASQTQPSAGRESLGGLLGGLLGGPRSSVERLPLLRTSLERTGAVCTEDLRAFSVVPAKLSLLDIASGSAAERLAPHAASAIGVLAAPGWNARLVVCARREVVFTLVEMVLGGDGLQPPFNADRPLTAIEVQIGGLLFGVLGKSLAAAFAPIAPTEMTLETASDKIDFDVIGKQEGVVAATFRLDAMGRGGDIVLLIPQTALAPMAKALAATPSKATVPPDARWMQNIQKEVTRTSVRLSATLEERMGILGEITNLRVGQVIPLGATAQSRVQVECNGERLMWCHLGKSNDFYTLRVDSFVDREQEFMNDILAA